MYVRTCTRTHTVQASAGHSYLDDVPAEKVVDFETAMHAHVSENFSGLLQRINESGDYDDDIANELGKAVEDFKRSGAY